MTTNEPTAAIVWQGLSAFTGAPTVAIVTGLDGQSENPKTGRMAQLWILRSDVNPSEAVRRGIDDAICGDCVFRGRIENGRNVDRGCYVIVPNAPRSVFAKFERGGYSAIAPELVAVQLRRNGLRLRLGAYGDPACVPAWLLANLTSVLAGHTGYTHGWRTRPDLAPFVMASVETEAEALQANAMGFRTFRTVTPDGHTLPGEITCPASAEAGHLTTCEACNLCDGSHETEAVIDRRKSIIIRAHGFGAVHALRVIRSSAQVAQ